MHPGDVGTMRVSRRAQPWATLGLLLAAATIIATGCLPSATPIATSTATATRTTPSATSTAPPPTFTPIPTASPTPTQLPTPDAEQAQVLVAGAAVRAQALAGDARVICLRYEETRADGTAEWVALVHQTTGTTSRLSAFVLDDEEVYPLEPVDPRPGAADIGFGQYPTCEIVVRDVNADGLPEIAIFGYAEGNVTLMHLFAWSGTDYRRLGFFSGDAGVRFVATDGDLEEEIWEGFRVRGAPTLAWYIVYTWQDNTYGWTSEHHDWYFTDRPQSYPTHSPDYAVIAFYLALNDRDLPGAYDLLAAEGRSAYEAWALGYATTLRVSVGSVHTIPGTASEGRARVAAMVTSWDNEGGVIIGRRWNVEWDTVATSAGWRLQASATELLEEWTVPYWP